MTIIVLSVGRGIIPSETSIVTPRSAMGPSSNLTISPSLHKDLPPSFPHSSIGSLPTHLTSQASDSSHLNVTGAGTRLNDFS
ncbi:hypothetical protein BT69DRAFT_1275606 [Atractiella rhizophila]|nr:hypothetical protein BT69DRAFT_1275606 [Atractiella rhizophila]